MKKFNLPFIMLLIIVSSCAGEKKSQKTDTIMEQEAQETIVRSDEAENEEPEYYLTHDGIGPIRLGISVNNLPESIENLYSRKAQGSTPDAMTIIFYDNEGPAFTAYDFGEAVIDLITLDSHKIKAGNEKHLLSIGESFNKVMEIDGAEPQWVDLDAGGMWYVMADSLWFGAAQETINQELSRKLYNPDAEITKEDFPQNVKIGFIGTGLPF